MNTIMLIDIILKIVFRVHPGQGICLFDLDKDIVI